MKQGKHPTSNIQRPTSNEVQNDLTSLWGKRKGMNMRTGKRGKHPTSDIQRPTSNRVTCQTWEFHEEGTGNRKYDLEQRLLEFACAVIDLSEMLPDTRACNHVAGQVLKSGTSPYPNHGEAEDAESREDFIHKFKICLKELRETRRWARLINRKGWARNDPALSYVLREADELVRIFFSSVQTAKRNILIERRKSSGSVGVPPGEAG